MSHTALFASSDATTGTVIIVLFLAYVTARKIYQAYQEAELRARDPQAYVRLKEIENDKEQRKHQKTVFGMKLGQSIAGWLLRHR